MIDGILFSLWSLINKPFERFEQAFTSIEEHFLDLEQDSPGLKIHFNARGNNKRQFTSVLSVPIRGWKCW